MGWLIIRSWRVSGAMCNWPFSRYNGRMSTGAGCGFDRAYRWGMRRLARSGACGWRKTWAICNWFFSLRHGGMSTWVACGFDGASTWRM